MYRKVCHQISVAYNHDGYPHGEYIGFYSYIAENDEILSKFFLHNNIIINWIDCNYTWGWFDYETGKWTGAVGKVTIYSV